MLNREKGAAPLYSQIAEILRSQIESGEFVKGDLFLTEKKLQELFGVSRITVRQAINELVNEGYLQCARGIGTTVVYGKIDESLETIISFTEEMQRHGKTMHTSYCEISKIQVDGFVAGQLAAEAGEECYKLVRVRSVGEDAIVYSITYLKNNREYPLDTSCYMESLYEFVKSRYHTRIVKGRDTLEAVLATEEISRFLAIEERSPVFKRVRKAYEESGKLFEYTVCYYPGDRYKYSIDL